MIWLDEIITTKEKTRKNCLKLCVCLRFPTFLKSVRVQKPPGVQPAQKCTTVPTPTAMFLLVKTPPEQKHSVTGG